MEVKLYCFVWPLWCLGSFGTAQNHFAQLNTLFAEYVPLSFTGAGSETHEDEEFSKADHPEDAMERTASLTTSSNPTTDQRNIHRCSVCDKTFPFVSSLLLHQKTHSTDRDAQCNLCGRSFKYSHSLVNHMRKTHSDAVDAVTSKTSREKVRESRKLGNPCTECGKCFSQWRYMQMHRKLVHGDKEKHFVCERCGASFRYKASICRHFKDVHETHGRWKCEQCGNTFTRNADLRKHMARMHQKM